jgi:hypothetical protein
MVRVLHDDREHVPLGQLGALADGVGHFVGLAQGVADAAVAVAHHDERAEAEATAALDHLGAAVDMITRSSMPPAERSFLSNSLALTPYSPCRD